MRYKNLAMWALALFLVLLLFYRYPPEDVMTAFKHADPRLFILIGCIAFLSVLMSDSLTLSFALKQPHRHALSFGSIFFARLESYLYATLNYNASQAVMIYRLSRIAGRPLSEVGFLTFIVMLSDFLWLTVACSFIFLESSQELSLARYAVLVLCGGVSIALAIFFVFRVIPIPALQKKSKIAGHLLSLMNRAQALARYPLKNMLAIFAYRLPHVSVAILSNALFFIPFKITILTDWTSFFQVIYKFAISLIVGALPLTPAGLGTTQSTLVYLFKDHVKMDGTQNISIETLIVTASLSATFFSLSLKCVGGFIAHVIRRRREKHET